MKRCPRCMRYDYDTTRFCRHCNTELFFMERFEVPEKKPGKIKVFIKRILRRTENE